VLLTVGDEDDPVRPLEHELPRRVVIDLSGNGVELQLGAHPADLAEIEGEKVEEERAVGLGGQREHLAAVVRGERVVDELQVRRLSAQARTVIDDLGRNFPGRVVEENHGIALELSLNGRLSGVNCGRVVREDGADAVKRRKAPWGANRS
jgi:hypothetical protein